MKISKVELGDSDAFLNSGIPTMVIVHVVLDNGQRITFPYQANQPIASLYESVNRAVSNSAPNENISLGPDRPINSEIKIASNQQQDEEIVDYSPPAETNNRFTIERRDTVKFIGTVDKNSPSELVTGRDYRVLDIIKKNGALFAYDIIDDNSPTKIRLTVLFNTVTLVSKAKPITEKKIFINEMIVNCPNEGCKNEPNALILVGDYYVGSCYKCGNEMKVERPKQEVK